MAGNRRTPRLATWLVSRMGVRGPDQLVGKLARNGLITTATASSRHLHGDSPTALRIRKQLYEPDQFTNITPWLLSRIDRDLLHREAHPLSILRRRVESYFPDFYATSNLHPVVSKHQNFDSILVPKGHVSRSPNDTYYVNQDQVLRTHTSAHQVDLFSQHTSFLLSDHVYRRDSIDATHYPIFHQMEGARIVPKFEDIEGDLRRYMNGLYGNYLFGEELKLRWVDAYFPFTDPSWEVEVWFRGEWLETCGCGITRPEILEQAGVDTQKYHAWAFGLGLERLAMLLFDIQDIRLFWTADERFEAQFRGVNPCDPKSITMFKPFSKHPPCIKDISFWCGDGYVENEFLDVVRGVVGDSVESIKLLDEFEKRGQGVSRCYRITYRSMDGNLRNEDVNEMQLELREEIQRRLGVSLR